MGAIFAVASGDEPNGAGSGHQAYVAHGPTGAVQAVEGLIRGHDSSSHNAVSTPAFARCAFPANG
jgi:hypothetical protein